MDEIQHLLIKLKELYPDKMVLDKMDEWERAKLAGKIELIEQIEFMVEENDG